MAWNIRVNPAKQFQRIEGFGASGAWWAQIVGGWEHIDPASGKPVRDRISELLYSKEKGIGLQIYRYNIGGGSKQSGKGKFSEPARRTESFDAGDSQYDWSRDAQAVYMMKRAVRDGAGEVVLFVNSPPERLTKNGKTHVEAYRSLHENLSRKNYEAFVKYCLDVTEHFVQEGLPVKYLSPINEPTWVWNGGQEGCHYRPASAGRLFQAFARALEERGALQMVKLAGLEMGDIRWFNKSYTRRLLRDPLVRRHLSSVDIHSYFHLVPLPFCNNRIAFLKRFRRWMDRRYPGVSIKMSEWTHMQGGRDKGMDSALVMAKTMVEDLSIMRVTSWQHWIAVSEVDFCDGLIYINLEKKSFEPTKRLYATGNFSRYLQPGARRIDASCASSELKVLAFQQGSQTVLIAVNFSKSVQNITVSPQPHSRVKLAVTDASHNLAERWVEAGEALALSPRSVNTLIFSSFPMPQSGSALPGGAEEDREKAPGTL